MNTLNQRYIVLVYQFDIFYYIIFVTTFYKYLYARELKIKRSPSGSQAPFL